LFAQSKHQRQMGQVVADSLVAAGWLGNGFAQGSTKWQAEARVGGAASR